jgi:hypothetical protein
MDEQQGHPRHRDEDLTEDHREATPPQTGISHGAGTRSDTGDTTGTPSSGATTGATGTASIDLRPQAPRDTVASPEPEERPAKKIRPNEADASTETRDAGG